MEDGLSTEFIIGIVGIPTALIPVIMFSLKQWAKTQKELQNERNIFREKIIKEQGDKIRDAMFAAQDLSTKMCELRQELEIHSKSVSTLQQNFNEIVRIFKSYLEKNEKRMEKIESEQIRLGKNSIMVKGKI